MNGSKLYQNDIFACALDKYNHQNYQSALDTFKKAISHIKSQEELVCSYNHIGYIYESGLGVSPDYGEALNWFKKSSELNDAYAIYRIGEIYRLYKDDNIRAIFFYERAAALDYIPAIFQLGISYTIGDIIKKDEELGERYLLIASKAGHFYSKALIIKRSLRGKFGLLGVFWGIWNLFYLPISVYIAEKRNPTDERLIT